MKRKKPYWEKEIAKAQELHKKGWDLDRIAREVGLSPTLTWNLIHDPCGEWVC